MEVRCNLPVTSRGMWREVGVLTSVPLCVRYGLHSVAGLGVGSCVGHSALYLHS